jgi:hypothetical protein
VLDAVRVIFTGVRNGRSKLKVTDFGPRLADGGLPAELQYDIARRALDAKPADLDREGGGIPAFRSTMVAAAAE